MWSTLSLAVLLPAVLFLPASGFCADGPVDFDREVRPLLSDRCFPCHGPDEEARKARLRLDTREGLFRERRGRTNLVAGDPAASELWRRISSADEEERMPPADSGLSLSDAERTLIERWIREGAAFSEHWAYRPPVRPTPPAIENDNWSRGDLDRFVLARLRREGWSPAPEASRERWLRRVSLDLTGLPPSLEELDAFLADEREDAHERVVDRLLASPRFGERMAWDWLDVARYADTNGFQGDGERTMWPWRDWVVDAFNRNLSFDRFTIEQLAGDLLPDATLETRLATGFHRNHMHNGEGGRIAEETRVENVIDRVETTATVWLGLTLTCARCHDHKYDPIAQREYYALYDIFNQCSENGGGARGNVAPMIRVPRVEDRARRREIAEELATMYPRVGELERVFAEREVAAPATGGVTDELRAVLAKPPSARDEKELRRLRDELPIEDPAYGETIDRLLALRETQEEIEKRATDVMVLDQLAKPRTTHVLAIGQYNRPGDEVVAGVPAVLPRLPADAPVDRLALARWLVAPGHPLTARVTVNRYWQLLFGVGLVKTTEDFGLQGEKPGDPALLDWLSVEFVESGWNLKALLRTIVLSATYRQGGRATADRYAQDPENRLLGRGPRHRLESWMLRDQALALSGLLVETRGGPPVKPYQPEGVWAEASFGKIRYSPGTGDELYRRSLYTFWRRIIGPTFLFDESKRQTCNVRASRTNTPLHALVLLNDTTYVEAARALAARVLSVDGLDGRGSIARAFRIATARRPDDDELDVLARRFDAARAYYAEHPDEASALLAVGESKRREDLDTATHAAMSVVTSVILNLDEVLTR